MAACPAATTKETTEKSAHRRFEQQPKRKLQELGVGRGYLRGGWGVPTAQNSALHDKSNMENIMYARAVTTHGSNDLK